MWLIDKSDPEAHVFSILGALKQILSEERNPWIDVRVFERDWLPLLISKVDPTQQANGGPPIVKWIDQVAGSAFRSVDVYDGEKFLYTVPPILNGDALVLPPNMTYYERIMYLKSLAATQVPQETMRAMQRFLVDAVGRDDAADTYMSQMADIAKFHGFMLMGDVPNQGEPDETTSPEELQFKSDF